MVFVRVFVKCFLCWIVSVLTLVYPVGEPELATARKRVTVQYRRSTRHWVPVCSDCCVPTQTVNTTLGASEQRLLCSNTDCEHDTGCQCATIAVLQHRLNTTLGASVQRLLCCNTDCQHDTRCQCATIAMFSCTVGNPFLPVVLGLRCVFDHYLIAEETTILLLKRTLSYC